MTKDRLEMKQFIAAHKVRMSCAWTDSNPLMEDDKQPKTGARCGCKPGIERDNCSNCEGTGMVVDFAAIRNRPRMNHWKCTLRCGRRSFTLVFSMGLGLSGEPEVGAVLDCLASDSAGIENAQSFEDWCGEYGYDADSRKAERIFKACETQAAKLKNLLGEDGYKTLLWETERL